MKVEKREVDIEYGVYGIVESEVGSANYSKG